MEVERKLVVAESAVRCALLLLSLLSGRLLLCGVVAAFGPDSVWKQLAASLVVHKQDW